MFNIRRSDLELWMVTMFGLFYMVTSMFLKSTVLMHTFYNLFIILILFSILDRHLPYSKAYGFLKIVNVFFWMGRATMYVINAFKFWDKSVNDWFYDFNNYMVSIPAYVVSILLSILYIYGRSQYRKV